jgi:hypothetical protein
MPTLLRIIEVVLALALLAGPAGSQEWEQFGFRRLGFSFDVPPGFVLKQTADNDRGATFETTDGGFLAVWGDDLPKRDFGSTVQAQLNADEEEGWNITYRRITPTWASYSGIKHGKIRYFRALSVCTNRVGIFQLDYDVKDKVRYDPVVVRMVRSLKKDAC